MSLKVWLHGVLRLWLDEPAIYKENIGVGDHPTCCECSLCNTLRSTLRRHFHLQIVWWKLWNSIQISLTFVPGDWIDNMPLLVQVVAWHQTGDRYCHYCICPSVRPYVCLFVCPAMSGKVWEWIYNFIQHFMMDVITYLMGLKLIHVSERSPTYPEGWGMPMGCLLWPFVRILIML